MVQERSLVHWAPKMYPSWRGRLFSFMGYSAAPKRTSALKPGLSSSWLLGTVSSTV